MSTANEPIRVRRARYQPPALRGRSRSPATPLAPAGRSSPAPRARSSCLPSHDSLSDPLGDLGHEGVPEAPELGDTIRDSGCDSRDSVGLPVPMSTQPVGKPISQQTQAGFRLPLPSTPL